MKILKYVITLPLLALLLSLPATAAIRLSTEKFEFNVKPDDTFILGSFTVQNDNSEAIRFKAYPEYFEISENGTILTELQDNSVSPLAKNIRFNPTEFTLNPNESQKIRFTITNIQNLPDGESRAALFLEDVKTRQQALPGNGNVSANLILKTRIAVPIYIDKGKIVKLGAIEKVNVEKSKNRYLYSINIKSLGNSLIRVGGIGQVIKDNQLVTEFPINEFPIQSGKIGLIKDFIPTQELSPNQQYILRITLNYKDQSNKDEILKEEVPFKLE